MNADVFAYLAFGCLLAAAFCAAQLPIVVTIWQGLKTGLKFILGRPFDHRPAQRPRFDIATARRESHALGLPFPESDGTLSEAAPPARRKSAEEVHAEIHARRLAAQPEVAATEQAWRRSADPAPTANPRFAVTAAEAAAASEASLHAVGSKILWHVEDCKCITFWAGDTYDDPRCLKHQREMGQ